MQHRFASRRPHALWFLEAVLELKDQKTGARIAAREVAIADAFTADQTA